MSDGQATGGDEVDEDDVDTDEDIESQAQPDFSPLDSRRVRAGEDSQRGEDSSRGLGAHASLR